MDKLICPDCGHVVRAHDDFGCMLYACYKYDGKIRIRCQLSAEFLTEYLTSKE